MFQEKRSYGSDNGYGPGSGGGGYGNANGNAVGLGGGVGWGGVGGDGHFGGGFRWRGNGGGMARVMVAAFVPGTAGHMITTMSIALVLCQKNDLNMPCFTK